MFFIRIPPYIGLFYEEYSHFLATLFQGYYLLALIVGILVPSMSVILNILSLISIIGINSLSGFGYSKIVLEMLRLH
jgi:hypothetical protein